MACTSIGAESGLQMLSRLSGSKGSSISNLQPDLFPPGLLKTHELVEVWGPDSVVVSRLCTHLLSRCLLPISVGGLGADAIFVDTLHHFKIHQLAASLENSLRKGDIPRKEIPKHLKTALNQLLILPCYNSTQLLSSIISLPQLIRSRPNKVALVVIDSPAAFYLPDLLAETNLTNIPSKDHYLAEMLSPFLNLEINLLDVVLIFSLPTNYKKSFVNKHIPTKSYSVHIKKAEQNDTSKSQEKSNDVVFEAVLHKGKAFIHQTNFNVADSQECWSN